MIFLLLFRYFTIVLFFTLHFFAFSQGMQTRERAHCARSVFPFIKKEKKIHRTTSPSSQFKSHCGTKDSTQFSPLLSVSSQLVPAISSKFSQYIFLSSPLSTLGHFPNSRYPFHCFKFHLLLFFS